MMDMDIMSFLGSKGTFTAKDMGWYKCSARMICAVGLNTSEKVLP